MALANVPPNAVLQGDETPSDRGSLTEQHAVNVF
jgi:hypothetical protein